MYSCADYCFTLQSIFIAPSPGAKSRSLGYQLGHVLDDVFEVPPIELVANARERDDVSCRVSVSSSEQQYIHVVILWVMLRIG